MFEQNFQIDSKKYSYQNPLIIAEIGTGHGGNLEKAKELIEKSINAGANCVKFQFVIASEILHKNTGFVPLPTGQIPLFDVFKNLEQNIDFYQKIKEETEKQGAIFLCSPFGHKSLADLVSLQPKVLKIASPELNYYTLIREAAKTNIPLIISTGVSTLKDIKNAYKWIEESTNNKNQFGFLHCITSYPAPEEEYNISLIKKLPQKIGKTIPWGISDHSLNPVLVPALAITQGAFAIEKHITLSKKDTGLDDPVALETNDFSTMVNAIREATNATENNDLKTYFNLLYKKYGEKRIKTILGNGKKRLAKSEKLNYGRTNRSLHATHDILKGTKLTKADFSVLRTEKILEPGLEPIFEEKLIGLTAKKDIKNGAGIKKEDLFFS